MTQSAARSDTALRLTKAKVLGSDGLQDRPVEICGATFPEATDRPRDIALPGLWLLPGIIDLHGDGFERHLAPRRGVVTDLTRALHDVETELAAAGITTAWLAQFWSWEGGMRGPEFAKRLAQALEDATFSIDIRLQLRFERAMINDGPAVLDLVRQHRIDYLVFNDHLPHQRLAEGRRPQRLEGSAIKAGRAPEAHLAVMQELHAGKDAIPDFARKLARDLKAKGLTLGSHDDADAEERARWGDAGIPIAEFPLSRAAASSAKSRGEPVIMGAPNVVRGGSHNRGGTSAEELIADGLVDALASDYHYPALANAALKLADRGALSLSAAWDLISANPARIMRLADRGRIAPGQRADLILFDPKTRRVVGVFSEGRLIFAVAPLPQAIVDA